MSISVSIVIPAYQNELYIEETLHSVLSQDYDDFEVIIADHSSSDKTSSVIQMFAKDRRLKILSPTPAGGGAVRNWSRVSAAATGKYIKLVCGDDLIAPDLLKTQVDLLEQTPDAVLAACSRSLIDANSDPILRRRGLQGLDPVMDGIQAVRATVRAGTNVFGEPACVMMSRHYFEQAGGWDNTYPYLIDEGTYAHILEYGKCVITSRPMASFRVSASQWSVRLAHQQASQATSFHQEQHKKFPQVISKADVLVGNLNAIKTSYMRRLAYLYLGQKRMQPSS